MTKRIKFFHLNLGRISCGNFFPRQKSIPSKLVWKLIMLGKLKRQYKGPSMFPLEWLMYGAAPKDIFNWASLYYCYSYCHLLYHYLLKFNLKTKQSNGLQSPLSDWIWIGIWRLIISYKYSCEGFFTIGCLAMKLLSYK